MCAACVRRAVTSRPGLTACGIQAAATLTHGMEVYSTVLWHLKKEVALSHLAQEVVALDRLSPHTWCVLGNCFSLQKVGGLGGN